MTWYYDFLDLSADGERHIDQYDLALDLRRYFQHRGNQEDGLVRVFIFLETSLSF